MAPDSARNALRRRDRRRRRRDAGLRGGAEPQLIAIEKGSRPGGLRIARRLTVGALGLTLALIVSVAWGSAFFYLAARLGVDARVRLSLIDGAHVYAGLVGGVIVLAKV